MRARVRPLQRVHAAVYVQLIRRGTCAIALLASMLAGNFFVNGTFVILHATLRCKLLFALVHVARVRLRKRVHDTVLFQICLLIESLLAQITTERRSIVHTLVCRQFVSALV